MIEDKNEDIFAFVDAHHHLWDLKALHYAWLTDKPFEGHPSGDYSAIVSRPNTCSMAPPARWH